MQRYFCLDKTCDVMLKFRRKRRSFKVQREAKNTDIVDLHCDQMYLILEYFSIF